MSIKKIMKTQPSDPLAAKGLLYHDWDALTPCQRECTTRLGMTIQIEQEAYLSQHPEIISMLQLFTAKMVHSMKRSSGTMKDAIDFFTRPIEELDTEIRQNLGIGPEGPYTQGKKHAFKYHDSNLEKDLRAVTIKHYLDKAWKVHSSESSILNTVSSSFISVITSDTTLPTPEPIPTPEPTLSETFFALVSNTIDKAVYSNVNDQDLRYDTAYVELSKAVEQAMEIPVVEIREDIARLFFNAYKLFELEIMERERIAAEKAWEKRMRKKMKRSLRRQKNFKGYETPPTPKSQISSHESYRIPPPRPCVCNDPITYNRYPKDRFGIYLPRDENFSGNNTTATPAISMENVVETGEENADNLDTKSMKSTKSVISTKSAATVTSKRH